MESLDKLREILAERLKHYREQINWTQHDLAVAANMATPTLRGYEQKKRWPGPEEIEAMAHALGIPAYKLFTNSEETTPREALVCLVEFVKKHTQLPNS